MTKAIAQGASPEPASDAVAVPARAGDDDLRRLAVERLAEHLDMGAALIGRCEDLASASRGDRLGPLYAAARLLRANAHVASALAQVAQVERRHRSFVQRIQPPGPTAEELNSRKKIDAAEARRRLEPRILGIVARIQAETEPNNPHAEAHARAAQEFEDEFGRGP